MIDHSGIRRIIDEQGVDWEVWEAHPRLADRRRLRERRATRRDDMHERRVALSHEHPPIADDAGWLVFKSAREERRRTPIPAGWELLPDQLLLDVLRQSRSTGPIPRTRR